MGTSLISLARPRRIPAQYHMTFVKRIMHKCTVNVLGQINKLNNIEIGRVEAQDSGSADQWGQGVMFCSLHASCCFLR